jgi:anaphase-promoting complex subunit 1
LGGHLRALAPPDCYLYLAQEHEPTTVALLLGCAASRAGTGDTATSRMLFLHLPARHPASYPELALPSLVQSAALLAVGLLHQGTGNALMAEIALGEISRRLGGDALPDREGYSLAAGLALGLIALGQGRDCPALGGLRLEERLLRLMQGGPSPEAGTGGAGGWDGTGGAGPLGGGARLGAGRVRRGKATTMA